MTPLDYEYLRKLLKERSGLDLSSDKQYLVESRLIPLARRVGLAGIAELVAKMKTGSEALTAEVAEDGSGLGATNGRDRVPGHVDDRNGAAECTCHRSAGSYRRLGDRDREQRGGHECDRPASRATESHLEVASLGLLALDRLEEGLEVAHAEAS